MANTKTAYGAILDTAGTALTTGFAIESATISETGGSDSAIVSLKDESDVVIAVVSVKAGNSRCVPLGGIRPDGVKFTQSGTGNVTISLIHRSR